MTTKHTSVPILFRVNIFTPTLRRRKDNRQMNHKGTITWTTALLLMLTILTANLVSSAGPAGLSFFQGANPGSIAQVGNGGWQSHKVAQLACVTGGLVQARNEHLMDGPVYQGTGPADLAWAPSTQFSTLKS
jgi:hypothetical protein